jgi:photosystem II stability/assembly factor-like uncharacterized protein
MKIISLSILTLFIFFVSSCKKSDPTPDPIPVPKPDTLSAGWKKITIIGVNSFADIFFYNNSTGYLVGDKTYKSVDGGLTWNVISNRSFYNLWVTNNGNVYLVNNKDSVYKSTDGGNTITAAKAIGAVSDVFFTDNNNGYGVAYEGLCNTTDGGQTWTKVNATGISFVPVYSSLFFTSNTAGFIVTANGVFKTNGNLLNWVPTSLSIGNYQAIYVTPNNTIYVSNNIGELYKSTDGGIIFSKLKVFANTQNTQQIYCDIHFVDNNTGYVSAGSRIYKTTDAGATWNVVVALGEGGVAELHFTDASHGWACGYSGGNGGTVLFFN